MHWVRASIWIAAKILYTTNFLSSTGAQRNLVAKNFFLASWMKEVSNKHNLSLCSVKKDPIVTLKQIEFYKGLGGLRAKKTFDMVERLSINILFGTGFMYKETNSIYPTERRLQAAAFTTYAILSSGASANLTIATASLQEEKNTMIAITSVKWNEQDRQVESCKIDLNQALWCAEGAVCKHSTSTYVLQTVTSS